MDSNLAIADSRVLDGPFSEQLLNAEPHAALRWLTKVLALQSPGLRSSNSYLVAYTGCPEAIDWIEETAASPVTEHWGSAAALLGTPWPRLERWLVEPKPTQLIALDALVAYRAPAPNMSPLAQIAAPVLPEAPSWAELQAALEGTLKVRSSPRIRMTIDAIHRFSSEILRTTPRGVAVEELPRLYLDPESYPGAAAILGRAQAVSSSLSQSIDEMMKKHKLI